MPDMFSGKAVEVYRYCEWLGSRFSDRPTDLVMGYTERASGGSLVNDDSVAF